MIKLKRKKSIKIAQKGRSLYDDDKEMFYCYFADFGIVMLIGCIL